MKLCEQAINDIEYTDQNLPYCSDFKRRDSLYYASYEEDIKKLEKNCIIYISMILKRLGYQRNKLDRDIHFKNVQLFIRIMMVK